jgi:alkylation response protein AidB-like acyl-CoA dehydrogenase
MDDLLRFLLHEHPDVVAADRLDAFWTQTVGVRSRFLLPLDRAVAGGRVSDRVGFAFACGYEAALHALVPSLPAEAVAGFSVTEERGNHPRAIETRLERTAEGYSLSGSKRWSTMAPLSDRLVVVATTGAAADGRPELRAVVVERHAPGLTVTEMPPPPFVPEVPHAELGFERVAIAEGAVLPGDGYTDYVKAFRTVEDLHVNASVLGYLLSAAGRNGWPDTLVERLSASVAAARSLSALDPKRAETHVALAGLLADVASIVEAAESSWVLASDGERERWNRDRVLTQVASKARAQRRARAFEVLRRPT